MKAVPPCVPISPVPIPTRQVRGSGTCCSDRRSQLGAEARRSRSSSSCRQPALPVSQNRGSPLLSCPNGPPLAPAWLLHNPACHSPRPPCRLTPMTRPTGQCRRPSRRQQGAEADRGLAHRDAAITPRCARSLKTVAGLGPGFSKGPFPTKKTRIKVHSIAGRPNHGRMMESINPASRDQSVEFLSRPVVRGKHPRWPVCFRARRYHRKKAARPHRRSWISHRADRGKS